MGYQDIIFLIAAAVSLLSLLRRLRNKTGLPTNYPIVGMLLPVLRDLKRLHDGTTQVLQESHCNFLFYGPIFAKMNFLSTADPANIHYIMSKNFANFSKGPEYKQIFDILGDGIFNADSDLWKLQRKITHSFMSHPRFHNLLIKTISTKVAGGLIPTLEHSCRKGSTLDLQDLLRRLAFDTTCILIIGMDPGCLAPNLPKIPFDTAMNEMQEALAFRHVVPVSIWKLCRLLGIWKEKQMTGAKEILDSFLFQVIAARRDELEKRKITTDPGNVDEGVDLLTSCILEFDQSHHHGINGSDKFLRDMILNLLLAGMDTTSTALTWFFWLVSTHPEVESKVREEVRDANIPSSQQLIVSPSNVSTGSLSKLVYLHGALSETMRLYPPVPYEIKAPLDPDILPSGHKVDGNMRIMIFLYSMGRMKLIWGDDCAEFKPERWISERGKFKHEPSYKFLAFNAGPRTCLGKEMAFIQMKLIVSSLIPKYHFEVVEGQSVVPEHMSIILHMKHGLKVRVVKVSD